VSLEDAEHLGRGHSAHLRNAVVVAKQNADLARRQPLLAELADELLHLRQTRQAAASEQAEPARPEPPRAKTLIAGRRPDRRQTQRCAALPASDAGAGAGSPPPAWWSSARRAASACRAVRSLTCPCRAYACAPESRRQRRGGGAGESEWRAMVAAFQEAGAGRNWKSERQQRTDSSTPSARTMLPLRRTDGLQGSPWL